MQSQLYIGSLGRSQFEGKVSEAVSRTQGGERRRLSRRGGHSWLDLSLGSVIYGGPPPDQGRGWGAGDEWAGEDGRRGGTSELLGGPLRASLVSLKHQHPTQNQVQEVLRSRGYSDGELGPGEVKGVPGLCRVVLRACVWMVRALMRGSSPSASWGPPAPPLYSPVPALI